MTTEIQTTPVTVVTGCLSCQHYSDAGSPLNAGVHNADAQCIHPGRPRAPWGSYSLPWSGYLRHIAEKGDNRSPPDWCPLLKLGDTVEVRS